MEIIILGVCQIILPQPHAPPFRQQKRLQPQESLDVKTAAEDNRHQKLHTSESLPCRFLEKSFRSLTPMTAGETFSPEGQEGLHITEGKILQL